MNKFAKTRETRGRAALVAAALCAAATALPLFADTNITESVMLTEDADWTSLGTVNIAAGAGIHLNGRNLTVSGFSGSGSIYSSAVLPAGYAVLEYVDSAGAQYINTGISPYSAAKIDADVAYIGGTANAYEPLLCSSVSDNNNTVNAKVYGLWVWPNYGNKWSVMFNGKTYNSSATVANGTRCKLVAQWSETLRSLTVDGVSKLNDKNKNTPTSTGNTMYMPAWNSAGTLRGMGKFRFYSVKIYNPQDTLKRNYVPAKRLSDNAVGFYDMVSKTFSPSATETAFVDGPEVERGGGELRINVASGTFQNSTVAISNSVKVVKTGTGSYKSSKTQSYTGGTLVSGGKVQSTVEHGFGAAGSAFSISNARVDIEGRNNTLKDYDVTIEDAGTAEVIQGAAKITGGSGYQKSFLKSLTLSGDASIGVWQEDAFGLTHNTGSIQPFTLTLNGHTLTIQGNNRFCANRVTVSDEGTINVRRSAGTSNTQFYPRGVFNAPLVTLDIGANAKMNGDSGFVVSNLVFSGTGGSQSTTVLGRYSPKVNSSLPTVVLGDATHHAPTLDLGSVSAVIGGVSFAAGSTVTVDVGSRTVNVGDCLVSFAAGAAPDLSVGFTLCTNGVAVADKALIVKDSGDEHGIYVKNGLVPYYARWVGGEWKFFKENGAEYEGEWTDGVTGDMQVRFSTVAEYEAACGLGVAPEEFVMTGFEGALNVTSDLTRITFRFDGGATIDANGGCVKIPASMAGGTKAFTVTNSAESAGVLVVEVGSGATVDNTAMSIAGNLKFLKTGAGTFIASKENKYTGGTVIAEGKARCTSTIVGSYGFGYWDSGVSIEDGGQIVLNGITGTLNGYNVTIAGSGPDGNGAIYGNVAKTISVQNLESLSLSADATVKTVASDAFNLRNNLGTEFPLNLCDHTLTVTGTARFVAWHVNVPDEGRIIAAISPGSDAVNNCFYSHTTSFNAPNVDFIVPAGMAVGGLVPYVVSNMTFGGVWQEAAAACTLNVLGRYAPQPSATRYPITTLGDADHLAPVLDLSALSGTYDATSRAISFHAGSSVTVETGSREIAVGDCLVSFAAGAAPDPSIGFTLCTNGIAVADKALIVKDSEAGHGIYVKNALEPVFAKWVGGEWKFFMENDDEYEGEWTGGVTSNMQVRFSTAAEYEAVCATNFTPAAFVMTGFEGAQNVTSDLARLSFIFEEGVTIDANGGCIKISAGMAGGTKAFTVTNSVESAGVLVVETGSGATVNNTAMLIAGNLKFVKTGAGTFVSAKAQTYTGGTDVEAGTVRPPDSPADNNYIYSGDGFTAFGTGPVNVLTGAVFDVRGNYGYTNVVLKGGTIANTLRTMGQTAKPGVFVASLADADVSHFNMYLSGSSKYDTSYGMAGLSTDLGGKTLEITEWGGLHLRSALTNGTVKVVESNGWFMFEAALDMRTTTFDNYCAIQVKANVELGEYIQHKDTQYIRGSGKMNIHERFVPISSTYFYGCTMLGGSTLDLSQRDTVFTSLCTNDENKVYSVSYADNATIKVKLGERQVRSGTKIVGWTSKPTNNVKFVAAEGELRRSFKVKDDGLYVQSGFVLIIR